MNYQSKTDDTRMHVQKRKAYYCSCIPVAVAVILLFLIGCASNPPSTGMTDVVNDQVDRPMREADEARNSGSGRSDAKAPEKDPSQALSSTGSEPVTVPAFPTFLDTGLEICTNQDGVPLIYLFTTSQCTHCQWGGGAYDFIVRYYAANGLIEAHHYDLQSGDDLLTEEIETKLPPGVFEFYHQGSPKDLVPYYNFGCKFDRVGNGYEKQDNLTAEGEEMRRVIDTLVRIVSEGERP